MAKSGVHNKTHYYYGFELEYDPSGNVAKYFCDIGYIQVFDVDNFFQGFNPCSYYE